jgi:putative membrane protein
MMLISITRGGLWSKRLLLSTWVLLISVAQAHESGPASDIRPDNFWAAWSWEPVVLGLLIAGGGLYAIGVTNLWRRSSPERTFARWHVFCFLSGLLVVVIALISPLHELGEALFSAHMAQHELLMLIAAPLLVLGRPLVPMLMALPRPCREALTNLSRRPHFRNAWNVISNPVTTWLIHGITLWAWHVPVLYQATLESDSVHALQHTCFLGSALLFWWTLLNGRYARMGYGAAVLYVFTTAVHSGALGALFTFSNRLWYPAYQGRTLAWNLTALQDQQLGGLIMWIPAGLVLVGTGLGFLVAMLRESERRASYSLVSAAQQRLAGRGGSV